MNNHSWSTQVALLERRRWMIWLPLAVLFLFVYFHRVAAGVVADSLMREFGIERASELGLLSSIYFYTYAALQVPAGICADSYGPRIVVATAGLVAAGGALLFGWAPTLNWLYFARFVLSFGLAFIYINMAKFYAEWFRTREFGTMSGLSAFIGNAGSIMAAAPLALLVDSIGWRTAFYLIGLLTFAAALMCWLLVRNRPQDIGLPAITELEAREGAVLPAANTASAKFTLSMRTVLGNWYTWPPFLASAGIYGVFMVFGGMWGVPYFMQVYGMTRVEAAGYVALVAAGYMIAPAVGYVSDKFRSRRRPYLVCTVVMLMCWLVFTLWNGTKPPAWALSPLCLFIGAGASGVALTLACGKEVNPPNMTGMATGTANVGAFIGTALLQPAFGWMLDRHWHGAMAQGVKLYPIEAWQNAFWLCAAVLALSLVCVMLIRETACTNISHLLIDKSTNKEMFTEGDE